MAAVFALALVAGGYVGVQAADSELVLQIDPATPDSALPVFTGAPAPVGYAGAVPVYDGEGFLFWVSPMGEMLSVGGDVLNVSISDNTTVSNWADLAGVTRGEMMILLMQAQSRSGRALRIADFIK